MGRLCILILFHLYWSRIVGTTNGVASCRLCFVQVPRYLPFALQVLAQLPGKQTALVAMTVSEWHGCLICQPVQKKQMFGWKAGIHLIYPLLLLRSSSQMRNHYFIEYNYATSFRDCTLIAQCFGQPFATVACTHSPTGNAKQALLGQRSTSSSLYSQERLDCSSACDL